MKNILITILFSISVSCCNFLEETPKDFLSPANFYSSSDDAIAAVNSVYDLLASGGYYGANMWELGERPSDNTMEGPVAPPDNAAMHTFEWASDNGNFSSFWQNAYVSINRANTGLSRIPGIEMNENLKARLIGELKFLRALNYFDLLKVFGPVPLVVEATENLDNLFITKSAETEIWNQIITDFQDAEAALPVEYSGNEVGRATRGAAKALLARALLYKGDFAEAAQKAQEVIDMNEYDLFDDVADLWDVTNENGIEHIFSVQYLAGVQGSSFSNLFAIRGARPPLTGSSTIIVRPELVNSFAENDQRLEVSILDSYTFDDGTTETFQPHAWKFFDPTAADPTDGNTNWPVIRFAEVLLIHAEALNEANNGPSEEAYESINKVRNRAGLDDLPQGLSQQQFRDGLLQERQWELCFEGHRYFDLKRFGKLKESMSEVGITVEDRHLLFPVPLRELDANPNLEQNQGY